MARKRKQDVLVLFPDIMAFTKKLTDSQFGTLMRAIFDYRFQGSGYEGDDIFVDMAFGFIKTQLDRYQEICETNQKNKTNEEISAPVCNEGTRNATECNESTRNATECHEMQRKPPHNHSHNHTHNQNQIHNQNHIQTHSQNHIQTHSQNHIQTHSQNHSQNHSQTQSQSDSECVGAEKADTVYEKETEMDNPLMPPTLAEVSRYANEKKLFKSNPITFYFHYEKNGWLDQDGQPIQDWKGLLHHWNKTEIQPPT